jgi:hypothetical protein
MLFKGYKVAVVAFFTAERPVDIEVRRAFL